MTIDEARLEAYKKAIDGLSRHKFMMFGYYAALWLELNKLCVVKLPSPFIKLCTLARRMR